MDSKEVSNIITEIAIARMELEQIKKTLECYPTSLKLAVAHLKEAQTHLQGLHEFALYLENKGA